MMKTNNSYSPNPPKKKGKGLKYLGIGLLCAATIAGSGAAAYGAATYAIDHEEKTPAVSLEGSSNSDNNQIIVMDVADVVTKIRPSVVEINTESISGQNSFFGQAYVSEGAGSGVILSEDGYIVTNHHVIDGADTISVTTITGESYPATLIGSDAQSDIAVIKIDAQGLSPATVGNSNDIKVGEAAIAIGNPLGSLGGTVTTGIVSAVGREITIENETMTLLQTDAAINSGNSGGGLFDVNGQLIGIVNAKQAAAGVEGLGFAIPISDVTSIISDLEQYGKVTSRPMLNASLQNISDSAYYGNNYSIEPGVYLVQIIQGGSADKAGLQMGDRVISFDGQEISSSAQVKNILKKHKVGDVVDMVINRQGEEMTIQIELQGDQNVSDQQN